MYSSVISTSLTSVSTVYLSSKKCLHRNLSFFSNRYRTGTVVHDKQVILCCDTKLHNDYLVLLHPSDNKFLHFTLVPL